MLMNALKFDNANLTGCMVSDELMMYIVLLLYQTVSIMNRLVWHYHNGIKQSSWVYFYTFVVPMVIIPAVSMS